MASKREKITPYERAAQFGGGASHATRNNSLHGHGGKPKVAHVGWYERPVYETDGSCAKKPPLRPVRAESPDGPLKRGTTLCVYIDKVDKFGIRMVIIGLVEVFMSVWLDNKWVVVLKLAGKVLRGWLDLDDLMAGYIRWQQEARKKRRRERRERARQVWTPTPALPLMLPAPHNPVVALLPARVA